MLTLLVVVNARVAKAADLELLFHNSACNAMATKAMFTLSVYTSIKKCFIVKIKTDQRFSYTTRAKWKLLQR